MTYCDRIGIVAFELGGSCLHGFYDVHVIEVHGNQANARIADDTDQRQNAEHSDKSHTELWLPHRLFHILVSLDGLLLNRIPHPPPERSVTSIKIKPNSHRLTDQIVLRNEPRRVQFVQPPAVLAVVAIV